jgi:hypothetical protein
VDSQTSQEELPGCFSVFIAEKSFQGKGEETMNKIGTTFTLLLTLAGLILLILALQAILAGMAGVS